MLLKTALICMALNVYYEARNQPVEGQMAVTYTVLNRVKDSRYPDKICDVVYQGKHSKITGRPLRDKCMFSWYCDGRSDIPHDLDAYRWAEIIVRHVWDQRDNDITDGSTHYHSVKVKPKWIKNKTFLGRIGDHLFYRWEKPQ
jgi:spore germination cell wall hydrolase CwlJ-like protein